MRNSAAALGCLVGLTMAQQVLGRLGSGATTVQSVLDKMKAANSYFLATSPPWDCSWTRGTYFVGNTEFYRVSGDAVAKATALAEGEHYDWETCSWSSKSTNGNDQCIGQTYLYFAGEDIEQNVTRSSMVLEDLGIMMAQNTSTDWWWIDATFMSMPTFAYAANLTGQDAYYVKMGKLFNATAIDTYKLWNNDVGLFWRDQSYIGKTAPNGQPVMWGRGNGWAFAALARVLEVLPADHPNRPFYEGFFTRMAQTLKGIQGSDGMWRSSLLDADEYSNPETTGSSLITAGMAFGVRSGLLGGDYNSTVTNAWNGLSTVAFQSSGLVGYCQPVGASPAPATPTDTSDFCVGQFLLAGAEMVRLLQAT